MTLDYPGGGVVIIRSFVRNERIICPLGIDQPSLERIFCGISPPMSQLLTR